MNRISPLKFLLFVFASFFSIAINAQEEAQQKQILQYIQKAMNYNMVLPQEKVYLHFDNTGYFENETMWFKAYVTNTYPAQKRTDLSKVLYVELLNPSGDVVKTTKWPIDEKGQAYGDMKLDTLFGSGFYEVRAYTRYMTNWGTNACFSRVFPVFSAPKEEGDYSNLNIDTRLRYARNPNNRDRSDSLYLKAIDEGVYTNNVVKTVSVQFFPEGGNLVKGLKSRVAMLAVDDNGRPFPANGFIQNANGDVLATVKADSLGRGVFEIVPDGSQLTMQLKNLKDKTQVFNLPKTMDEGCTINFDAVNEDMLVTFGCSNGICGKLLGFSIINNGNLTYCDTVHAEPLIELSLDRERQREGVNQFTIFDSSGHILAERMFFIFPQSSPEDSIYINPITKRLKPCGTVELEVKTLPNSTFSFSAVDAVHQTNGKQGNMKTWMLLSSDVKGFINNVDYYFESDDTEHRQAADLLMMTQGWRRYDWEVMSGVKEIEKAQPIEDKFYIFGKLNEYRKKNPSSNVAMDVYLYNESGETLSGSTVTDEQGKYAFELPFMDGEWSMQIFTKINDKRKTFYVGIDRQFSPTPRYITPAESNIYRPLAANMFNKKTNEVVPEEEVFIPITERNHVLENVTVKANRRYFTNDDWKYKNEGYGSRYATLFYDIDKERDNILDMGGKTPTIFEFLCKKNALFNNPDCKELPTPPLDDDYLWRGKMAYANRPIKWIVDNGETLMKMPVSQKNYKLILGTEMDTIANDEEIALMTSNMASSGDDFFPIWMDEIKHIYIVPDSPKEVDGAVRIYLYMHHRYTTASQKGLRRTYFQGFNKPSTFQMEDYSVLPPMADFRRTIYWNPNVRTDASGKAKVEFYNNSTCQEMRISAEGISAEGKVLVNE